MRPLKRIWNGPDPWRTSPVLLWDLRPLRKGFCGLLGIMAISPGLPATKVSPSFIPFSFAAAPSLYPPPNFLSAAGTSLLPSCLEGARKGLVCTLEINSLCAFLHDKLLSNEFYIIRVDITFVPWLICGCVLFFFALWPNYVCGSVWQDEMGERKKTHALVLCLCALIFQAVTAWSVKCHFRQDPDSWTF